MYTGEYTGISGKEISDKKCSDSPSNSNGESPFLPVSAFDDRHLTTQEGSRPVEDLMRVAMIRLRSVVVRVPAVIMGVRVTAHLDLEATGGIKQV